MEVGSGQHCTFITERIGSATAIEHLPNPEKSLITAIFFLIVVRHISPFLTQVV